MMVTRLKNLNTISFDYKKHHCIGGNQSWFSNYTRKIGGCGPVSAANILAYMAFNDAFFTGLYEGSMQQQAYLVHMKKVYGYVKPNELYNAEGKRQVKKIFGIKIPPSFGIRSLSKFRRGISKYAKSNDIELSSKSIRRPYSYEKFKDYIKEGLENNYPIALRNMFNSVPMYFESPISKRIRKVGFQLHWVTVVGLIEEKTTWIEVLTWAGLAKIDLKVFWELNRFNVLFPVKAIYFIGKR